LRCSRAWLVVQVGLVASLTGALAARRVAGAWLLGAAGAGQNMCRTGAWPPYLAAWLPEILFVFAWLLLGLRYRYR